MQTNLIDDSTELLDMRHLFYLKQGVAAWNIWRERNPNIQPNLQNMNLRGIKLENINLCNADLHGVNFYTAKLKNADFYRADLSDAKLSKANLSGADLREVYLNKAHLNGANLTWANLSRADLSDAKLSRVDLRGATLNRASLIFTCLSKANLEEVNLRFVDLSNADLSKANLARTSMNFTNLELADLTEANLRGADLNWSNLFGANFSGADLRGANLKYASLITIVLQGAKYNSATMWPTHFDPVKVGAIKEEAESTHNTNHQSILTEMTVTKKAVLKNERRYEQIFFPADIIIEATEELEKQFNPEQSKPKRFRLVIDSNNEKWTYAAQDEFFAQYDIDNQDTRYITSIENAGGFLPEAELNVHYMNFDRSRFPIVTIVKVKGSNRAGIEAIFEIFEKNRKVSIIREEDYILEDEEEFWKRIKNIQVESLREQQKTYAKNLNMLEEQASLHGGIKYAPINIQNSIELTKNKIDEIARELKDLDG